MEKQGESYIVTTWGRRKPSERGTDMSDTKQEITRSKFKAMREKARLDSLEKIRAHIEYAYDWETIQRRIERHAATFSRTYAGLE